MAIELVLQAVLPFLLLGALVATAYQAIFIDVTHLWKYLVLLVAIALLRALYGAFRTRDLGFFLFVAYGFVHVLVLIPTRLYALATIGKTHWGTRVLTPKHKTEPV